MDWEEVVEDFQNLIKYASKQVYLSVLSTGYCDLMLDSQDLFQEGMIILYDCWQKYTDKPKSEFKSIFSVTLFRNLKKIVRRKVPTAISLQMDENGKDMDVIFSDDEFEDIFLEFSVSQVKELLAEDTIALLILDELLNPSERTIWEMHMDGYRKKTVANMGLKVNTNINSKIKMLHIRRALQLTQKQFDDGLLRLRKEASLVLSSCLSA